MAKHIIRHLIIMYLAFLRASDGLAVVSGPQNNSPFVGVAENPLRLPQAVLKIRNEGEPRKNGYR
jgi:hypothetical protein